MANLALNALLLWTLCAVPMAALAQATYKCGNSYSQTPCAGAVTIVTEDARTGAQKTQTDKATLRDARIADAMQKARLQQEARDLAANTPAAKASTPLPSIKNEPDSLRVKNRKPPKALPGKAVDKKKKKKNPSSPDSEKKPLTNPDGVLPKQPGQ